MCHLRNMAIRDYQESVTTGQTDRHTDGQTDARQSDSYVPLCFAGDTKIEPDGRTNFTNAPEPLEISSKNR